jgi:hypothetical protein
MANGGQNPSSLALAPVEVPIKDPTKCSGAKAATISANLLYINLTSLAEAIKVT